MKTAYKDLKLKLSERTPSKGGSSSMESSGAASSTAAYIHHSAPNSPVFTKKPQSHLVSISNSSAQQSKPAKTLQNSNSMISNSNLNNHFNNNLMNDNNNSNVTGNDAVVATANNGNCILRPAGQASNCHSKSSKSPITVSSSPTSSLSSTSEMNILQELQQHALFKLPTVNRSVSLAEILVYGWS